jgi:hypothetical protein
LNLLNKIRNDFSTGVKIKTLIFLTPRPVSQYEEQKWAFDYLRSRGFTVLVMDLSLLLNNKISHLDLVPQELQGDFIFKIKTYQELERHVGLLSGSAIYVDYLVAHSNVSLREERVFRVLKKYQAKYIFLSSGALPHPGYLKASLSHRIKILHSKIEKVFNNPFTLINFLASKVILLLTRYSLIYPKPTLIFGGESLTLKNFIAARGLDDEIIVPINSYDYDSVVSYKRKLGGKKIESEQICVFIDEAATHHSDFSLFGIKPAESKSYFLKMNQFFEFVEMNTGLKVVIAAHPRSNYESMPDVFAGRDVIKGKTIELVSKSKLVLMHMSTALSYAVLFKKPVTFIKIPGMKNNDQLNLMVETMATSIGSNPIDLGVDKDEILSALLRPECFLDKYSDYAKNYIYTEGAGELSEWEIVANTLVN